MTTFVPHQRVIHTTKHRLRFATVVGDFGEYVEILYPGDQISVPVRREHLTSADPDAIAEDTFPAFDEPGYPDDDYDDDFREAQS